MEEERSSSSLSTSASESSESSWTGNPCTPTPSALEDGVTLRRKPEPKSLASDSGSVTVKPRVMSLNFLPKPYSKPTGDPISPIVFKSFQAPETGRSNQSVMISSPKPPIAPKPKIQRGKTTDF